MGRVSGRKEEIEKEKGKITQRRRVNRGFAEEEKEEKKSQKIYTEITEATEDAEKRGLIAGFGTGVGCGGQVARSGITGWARSAERTERGE